MFSGLSQAQRGFRGTRMGHAAHEKPPETEGFERLQWVRPAGMVAGGAAHACGVTASEAAVEAMQFRFASPMGSTVCGGEDLPHHSLVEVEINDQVLALADDRPIIRANLGGNRVDLDTRAVSFTEFF